MSDLADGLTYRPDTVISLPIHCVLNRVRVKSNLENGIGDDESLFLRFFLKWIQSGLSSPHLPRLRQ